jgi:hypothetical protein
MISCDVFRAQFAPAAEDPAMLEHIRSCDACLNHAITMDGDVLFRALGGDNVVPPGGVDAFVDDVMRAVRIRGTESMTTPKIAHWPRKLAVAAMLTVVVAGGSWMFEHRGTPVAQGPMPQTAAMRHVLPASAKPIIEKYDSNNATIVEVPTEGTNVRVVMVFDESLPADL